MTRSKHWFLKLHDEVIAKLERECEEAGRSFPENSNQQYGYGNYEPGLPNLVSAFENHPRVRSYLEELNKGKKEDESGYKTINGKYLYNKKQEAQKKETGKIKISEFYETIFLFYLDFNNWQEFRNSFEVVTDWKQFQCFYYSFKRHAVRNFIVDLNISKENIQARMKGFHDKESAYIEGRATLQHGRLHVRVANEEGYEMTLIATTGNERLENLKYMYCVFLTVSSAGFPVSHRGFLLRENGETSNENDELRIRRYMMLKRQAIRAPSRVLSSLADLRINRSNSVERIAQMVGTYRTWRYDEKRNIVQSKLVIGKDYATTIYTNLFTDEFNKQICLLNLSTEFNHKLCISTHPANASVQIIYYAMIDIPYTKEFKFTNGAFCFVGTNRDELIGRDMVLYKDDTPFEPKVILKEEIEGMIQEHADLHLLQSKLAALEEKRFK